MKRRSSKAIAVMMATLMIASVLPIQAFAKDYDLENGNVVLDGNVSVQKKDDVEVDSFDHAANNDYTLNVSGTGDVTLTGETQVSVSVETGSVVTLNLNEVTMNIEHGDAIVIENDGSAASNVEIVVDGENNINGGHDDFSTGIQIGKYTDEGEGADVVITGDGSLNITGFVNSIDVGKEDTLVIDGSERDLDINLTDFSGANEYQGDDTYGIVNNNELTIQGGADITIDTNAEPGERVRGIETMVGAETVVTGEGTTIEMSGNFGEGSGFRSEKDSMLTITDNAVVDINITSSGSAAIDLDAADALISGGADVTLHNNNQNALLMGTNAPNTLTVTGEGTTLTADSDGKRGINMANEKTLLITDGAVVDVSGGKTGENGVDTTDTIAAVKTYDNDKIVVENATLNAGEKQIILGANSVMYVNENASVTTAYVTGKPDKGSEVIVTGGTLALTTEPGKGLNKTHSQQLYTDVESSLDATVVWPTNGSEHGNDKLVNFILPADAAHAAFDTIDANGNSYRYLVDLNKESSTLSVWVPAALLTYYYKDD